MFTNVFKAVFNHIRCGRAELRSGAWRGTSPPRHRSREPLVRLLYGKRHSMHSGKIVQKDGKIRVLSKIEEWGPKLTNLGIF